MFKLDYSSGKWQSIISKAKSKVIAQYAEAIQKKIHITLKEWKTEIRMLLSMPHVKGTRSNGLYPRMRTGSLRRSLSYRTSKVVVSKRTGHAVLRFRTMWDDSPKGTGDYGEELNSSTKFATRRFFGWKHRAHSLLMKRIKGIM